jgi:glucose-1-phosphate cytidylyltransferase
MRYYAHYGHKDFVLCLGYRGELIRKYFLEYNSFLDRDFVMTNGGSCLEPKRGDIDDWRITFVDTGLHSNIGERLVAVRKYVQDEEFFLANYSDQVCDIALDAYVEQSMTTDSIASFLSVRPSQSYHSVVADSAGQVEKLVEVKECDFWVNGGYFVLRRDIFDYIEEGEELVVEPFARLAQSQKLWTHRYDGFWKAMDTFKDKIEFDRMDGQGRRPWCVWNDHKTG